MRATVLLSDLHDSVDTATLHGVPSTLGPITSAQTEGGGEATVVFESHDAWTELQRHAVLLQLLGGPARAELAEPPQVNRAPARGEFEWDDELGAEEERPTAAGLPTGDGFSRRAGLGWFAAFAPAVGSESEGFAL